MQCPKCKSNKIQDDGVSQSGNQLFRCRSCSYKFMGKSERVIAMDVIPGDPIDTSKPYSKCPNNHYNYIEILISENRQCMLKACEYFEKPYKRRYFKRLVIILALIIIVSLLVYSVVFIIGRYDQSLELNQPQLPTVTTRSENYNPTLTPKLAPTTSNYPDIETNKIHKFGPGEGDLVMGDKLQIDYPMQDINLLDFVVEVEFTNPYSASNGNWDYGLTFLDNDQRKLVLIIISEKKWAIIKDVNDSMTISSQGTLYDLHVGKGEINSIKLITYQLKGWLIINDEIVQELPIPNEFGPGSIGLFSGYFMEDRIMGNITSYNNWNIWSLDDR